VKISGRLDDLITWKRMQKLSGLQHVCHSSSVIIRGYEERMRESSKTWEQCVNKDMKKG